MTAAGPIGLTLQSFKALVADGFRVHEPQDPLEWMQEHVGFPDGWETTRFDLEDAPHVRGVIERFVMDPTKRKANLCWGVRLGKTAFVLSIMGWKADQDPVPMVLLYPDNDSLENVDSHLYPLFEENAALALQLPPEHKRNRRVVRLRDCRIRLASGGKKSSVSGYPARWIGKTEHDKISQRRSSEADPSLRVESRASGFSAGVKIIEEGTPAKKDDSRVALLLESDDVQRLRFHVQCPHCKTYQVLEHDRLRWDHNEHGRSEPELARRTAWYECEAAGCRIGASDRGPMMRAGKWLAEGESIDKRGRIRGKPKVDSATMVFGPLSKLNSLLVDGWGDIAADLVTAVHAYNLGNPTLLETFYAETLAIPWEPRRRTIKTPALVQRLRAEDHPERGQLPAWTSFLTLTSDVGKTGEELIFYWMVCAWGRGARGGIVDWGYWQRMDNALAEWEELSFPMGSRDVPLWGQPAGFDSGTFSDEIYRMCRPIRNCYPLKGDTNSRQLDLYWPGLQRSHKTPRQIASDRKAGRWDLLMINSELTQQWRVALIEGRLQPDDPGFVSLPADVCDEWENFESFLEELTEDQKIDNKWQGENNEYGDTLRYARALAQCVTRNGSKWPRLRPMAGKSGGAALFERSGSRKGKGPRFVEGWN